MDIHDTVTGYLDFSNDGSRRDRWANHLDLPCRLDDDELERLWSACKKWIIDLREILIRTYKWRMFEDTPSSPWLFIMKPPETNGEKNAAFELPVSFSEFLNGSGSEMLWDTNFNCGIFQVGITVTVDGTELNPQLHPETPEPLVDIFYLLQCIAPGMLLIGCMDSRITSGPVDTVEDIHVNTPHPKYYLDLLMDRASIPCLKYERGLPPIGWLKSRESILRRCLRNQMYERILEKAGECGTYTEAG